MNEPDVGTNGNQPESGIPPGVVTLASPVDVDQLLRRVVVQIEKLGLELFAVIDHSGDAAEVGMAMPDTKLVIFGNPRVGTPLILAHPLIALDLPLKLLLRETEDHGVFVDYNAPSYLADRHGLSGPESDSIRAAEAIARFVVSG